MYARSLALFVMVLSAPSAWAQTGKHVAIGGALGVTSYTDKDFSSRNPGVSPTYRIILSTQAKDGWSWAPKSSLGWSKRNTTTDIGGIRTHLGKLQTILIMAGVQRVFRQGPRQIGFGVVGGASLNHFDVDSAPRAAYLGRLGRTLNDVKVKNSFAVKPEVSAWYDLNQWFAVQGSVSYLFNGPKAETTAGGVTTSAIWKTDHASASVGLVVGIF